MVEFLIESVEGAVPPAGRVKAQGPATAQGLKMTERLGNPTTIAEKLPEPVKPLRLVTVAVVVAVCPGAKFNAVGLTAKLQSKMLILTVPVADKVSVCKLAVRRSFVA